MLKRVGIILSEKKRGDGSPVTGLIKGPIIEYLGVKLDIPRYTVESGKGKISLNNTLSEISKCV
jgi:hypothetical protein